MLIKKKMGVTKFSHAAALLGYLHSVQLVQGMKTGPYERNANYRGRDLMG